MRIVHLILIAVAMGASAIFAAPSVEAASDADRKEVTAIVATLHMVESELIRQSVLRAPEYKNSVEHVLALVRTTVKEMSPPLRGCQPGFCLRDDMCVPCETIRKKQIPTPELFQILATLHLLENELMREFEQGSPEFKNSKTHMRKLALESGKATNRNVPFTRCQPMFCLVNGICWAC